MEKMIKLGFAHVGKSQICLFHRPAMRSVVHLKKILGVTMIVTVQNHTESPKEVGGWCKKNGMKHLWI